MKKFLSRGIAAAILISFFGKAQAQVEVTYGPELAGSFVGLVDDSEVLYAGLDGQVGGAAHVQIGRFFAVRPSVFFRTTTMIDAYDSEYKMSLLRTGMHLPLLFSYNFEGGSKVFVGAGPSMMFHLGGKVQDYNSDKRDLEFGTGDEDDMKPVDIGLHLKAGFQFSRGLSLNLFFTNSLADLRPVAEDYGKLKMMDAFGFGIGWMFGGNGNED
jgi:hypothetical protein